MSENITDENQILTEATTNADIGTADFNFNQLLTTFEELPTASLIRSIAAVVPMKYSTGKVINVRRQALNNSFETVSANLTVNTGAGNPVQSGISIEAAQDLQAQYGLDGYKLVANMLRGIIDEEENNAFITWLDTNSTAGAALTLSAPTGAEQNLFEITQRVQELVITMNSGQFRTYDAFCVLPYKSAAAISALSRYVNENQDIRDRLWINKIGHTTYFVNPQVAHTNAYVGLMGKGTDIGASSVIMGTYQEEILHSKYVESFQPNIGILNRYATALNPLSTAGNEMLHKFAIS